MSILTTAERDLLRDADAAMDRYDKAQTSRNQAEIAKARADLERIRGKLEKARDPSAQAREVMRKALAQPIDAATGALVKANSGRRVIDHRSDRFDKLQRTGALSK